MPVSVGGRVYAVNGPGSFLPLRESSESSREILKTSVVREGGNLVCELFLALGHVVVRVSVEHAVFEVSRLRGKGFHYPIALLAIELPDETSGKVRIAES